MTTKQTRTAVATPTHAITTTGTVAGSTVGYSTLAQVKAQMGFGTAADSATTDFATSAQGTSADTAFAWGDHALAGYVDQADITFTRVLYVSKDGLDANAGDSIAASKLTIGSAITAASALISGGATGVRIEVLDGGMYTENITIPPLVAVLAPAATLVGTATIDGNSVLRLNRHFAAANSQTMAEHGGATDGPALY